MQDRYDILIVGSGVAGSMLALILGRMGVRVLVIERGAHPRFAIGESTLPTTTLLLRRLAEEHDVPELAEIVHYFGLRRLGITCYPKQHFWFGYHRAGQPMSDGEELVLDTVRPPIGPDVHVLREELDAFLVSRFSKYQVDYSDRTELKAFEYDGKEAVVRLATRDGERDVRAQLVVDASGHASCLGARFGLREKQTRLTTRSRSLFGHFRGVKPLDEAVDRPYRFRRERDRGTVHHVFDGGWLWVIPFDHGITSVGLQIDPNRFPLDREVDPEVELRSWIDRFPTIRAHLGEMRPIRPLVRTGRVQFSSTRIVGDGFVLTPHAAGFIDPLYSTGLLMSAMFITRFAAIVPRCLATGDFSAARFQPVEDHFLTELEHMDRVVGGTFASFRDFQVFRQFWRVYTHSSVLQYFGSAAVGTEFLADNPMLYGAAFPAWRESTRRMHALVEDRTRPAAEIARELRRMMDAIPHPFRNSRYDPPAGSPVHLDTRIDQPFVIRYLLSFIREPELRDHARVLPQLPMLMDVLGFGPGRPRLAARYLLSRARGGGFHHWMDRIDGAEADVEPARPTEFERQRPVATLAGDVRRVEAAHQANEPHGINAPAGSAASAVERENAVRQG